MHYVSAESGRGLPFSDSGIHLTNEGETEMTDSAIEAATLSTTNGSDAAGEERGRSPGLSSRRAPRILVIDDDEAMRESLADVLRGEGFEVGTSSDGRHGLAQLRERGADLLLLDLHMPAFDGWEFRSAQRAEPELANIPVVAISADDSPQARAIHADAYLRKPLEAPDVIRVVGRLLREKEMRELGARLAEAERLAALGRLAAGVGHEINNPLTYVMGNLSMLAEDLAAAKQRDPRRVAPLGDVDTLMTECLEGLERIRRIVGSLQQLSRPSEPERAEVNLTGVIDRAIATTLHEIRPRATLVRRIEALPAIEADEGALTQLFVNLMVNAAQAIEEGRAGNNEVIVRAEPKGNDIVVEVTDTGQGIAPQVLPHVFDPFFTTKSSRGGTGLGLAISRQIVESHHGQMEVHSDGVGRGTTVRVRLPIFRATAHRAVSQPSQLGKSEPARARILVVDDEPSVLTWLSRILSPRFEVVTASGATTAMQHIERGESFDAILCDLIMPNGGGEALQAGLAAQRPALLPRLVFMTGGAFTARSRQILEQGSSPVLYKPFRSDEVIKALADLVARLGPETQGTGRRHPTS